MQRIVRNFELQFLSFVTMKTSTIFLITMATLLVISFELVEGQTPTTTTAAPGGKKKHHGGKHHGHGHRKGGKGGKRPSKGGANDVSGPKAPAGP